MQNYLQEKRTFRVSRLTAKQKRRVGGGTTAPEGVAVPTTALKTETRACAGFERVAVPSPVPAGPARGAFLSERR